MTTSDYQRWLGHRLDGITHVKVSVNEPVNQDLTTILITSYGTDREGKPVQYYVQDFLWVPYKGFDMLDVQNVSFPGFVQFRVASRITQQVAGPRASRPD